MDKKLIGKRVIVRAYGAGVFFGTLAEKAGDEVMLTDARRLWYWDGAASISQIAMEGVKRPDNSKFTMAVNEIVIEKVIEIIPCTDEAIANIEAVEVWKR